MKVHHMFKRILSSLALVTLGFFLAIGVHRIFLKEEILFTISPTWIEGQPGVPGIYALLIILSLAVLYGLYSNQYLYKWRQKLSSEPHLLMPEEYIETMEKVETIMNVLSGQLKRDLPKIHEDMHHKTKEIHTSFLKLHDDLDERDKEIRQLKRGGDLRVFEQFLRRFVKIDEDLEDFLNRFVSKDDSDNHKELLDELQYTKEELWNALEECEVEKHSPELGGNYRHTEGLSGKTKQIPTRIPEEDYQISSVQKPGYRVPLPDNKYQYIKEAEVTIKRYQEEDEEENNE